MWLGPSGDAMLRGRMAEIPEHASAKVLLSRFALEQEKWRVEAEDALVALGDTVVDLLIGALGHARPEVRYHAVRALARLRCARAVPTIAAHLGDTENRGAVAIAAEKALVDLGAPAVEALLAAARDGAEAVRPRAVRALGRIAATPVEALRTLCASPQWTVRAQALAALARRAGEAAVPTLVAAIGDAEDWVRRSAAEALVDLRHPAGRPLLERILGDRDEEFDQHVWAQNLLDRLDEYERVGELKSP